MRSRFCLMERHVTDMSTTARLGASLLKPEGHSDFDSRTICTEVSTGNSEYTAFNELGIGGRSPADRRCRRPELSAENPAVGTTNLALSPPELIEKLPALVPPPRLNLVHYHGVLASNPADRGQIVPGPKPGLNAPVQSSSIAWRRGQEPVSAGGWASLKATDRRWRGCFEPSPSGQQMGC